MSYYDIIVEHYPELAKNDKVDYFGPEGVIELRDDGDGIQYISKWDFDKPIPEGLKQQK